MSAIVRKRVRITGVVQGVGFRPFVWRRATRLELTGWVENDTAGVTAELQGTAAAVFAFLEGLASAAPPLARVTGIESIDVPLLADDTASRFAILESITAPGPRNVAVPPDIAPCEACLAEMADPGNRRHGYPLINCTDCGPRFTIIEALPYDRGATTMRSFTMCDACAAEYRDPSSRRFHAQPNACPTCGPTVWFAEVAAGAIPTARSAARCLGSAAVEAARAMLRRGGIVAIKGVGGFQVACEATNTAAVQRLRDRKQRPRKPFAVMVADVAAARELAHLDEQERRLLADCERPIVLLRPRADARGPALRAHPTAVDRRLGGGKSRRYAVLRILAAAGSPTLVERSPTPVASPSWFATTTPPIDWICSSVSAAVAPGNDFLGLMLPSSPLHHLLCRGMPPLVMTSGNLADEPLAAGNADAVSRLARLADGFLLHDRDIQVPCDDSVMRCVAGLPLPIRRARGQAPLPIRLARGGPPVLAVGGELKAAICLTSDDQAVISQHIGDMGNLETLEALDRAAAHLMQLFDVVPAAVIADLHPGYLSTGWARNFAAARGLPLVQVQHHEAHVAALLAEHGLDLGSVPAFIGVCFDGTGYGHDGTIQGGEFFVAAGGGLRRAAHLLPFPLPGGDAAIRHPWRVAVALLREAGIPWSERLPAVGHASAADRDRLARQLARGLNCVATTSMGRLFDAVASLVGVCHSIDYEAEAALNLEALAASVAVASRESRRDFTLTTATDRAVVADWRPLLAALVADISAGEPPAVVATAFHDAIVRMVVDVCSRLRDGGGGQVVGLTGGVFQNRLLVERSLDALHAAGFEVLTHHIVPPNDGGLALGQAVLGRLAMESPFAPPASVKADRP